MFTLLFILSICLVTACAKNEELEGKTLYQIKVQNLEQEKIFNEIAERLILDVWSYAASGHEGLVIVPRNLQHAFHEELSQAGIVYKVEVSNIKEAVDLEENLLAAVPSIRSNRSHPGLPFDRIHRYAVVDDYLVQLGQLYPNVVRVMSGGRSIQGRDIKYLRISTTNFEDLRKPVIMLMSLLHAREWITLPATLYAIHKLVIDVTEQDLVRDIDWIILPIANPDGYEFSHTSDRFWRKNRALDTLCMGVDLNRNFDFLWGTISSNNPCSETFHGQGPFSEPETQIIRNIVMEHRNRLEMFLDIHSFGSMILFGFGNGQLPLNALTLNLAGVNMAQKIDAVKWPENRNYIVGNSAAILWGDSGASTCWTIIEGVPLSYTFELPAHRNSNTLIGFLVDPPFIRQAGFETWEGIKEGARWVVQNTRMKQTRTNEDE